MPATVHAILVVRPDGRNTAAAHLQRTLAALSTQTRRVDAITIVICGKSSQLHDMAAASGAESVITAPASTGFAAATAIAGRRVAGDTLWVLAQDTAPEPDALARLVGALELAPSVAIAAPKLVSWDDRSEIVSLGVSMTSLGRSVGLADGELDQGQHDAGEDVLGSDVRGILMRTDAWRSLEGIDTGLSGGDEGLDLAVRSRLAGGRVTLVPTAIVAVGGDGVAGLPGRRRGADRRRAAFAGRAAQLHRRLVYAPAWAVPLHWLSLLPLALWRTIVHLVRKQPGLVWAEWRASFVAMFRLPSVVRARGRIRRTRTAPWSLLSSLRVSRSQLRERLDDDADAVALGPVRRTELRFFSGGGAWLVLAALAASVGVFTSLLAWPVLGGGGLQPLRSTLTQLWADAAYGQRALGLDTVGPADPFAAIIALLGSLWPADPSRTLVVLWVLALPLAALGGWFAATRLTERPLLRLTSGVVWALAPTLLAALVQGRPAAVLTHLLLPWLFYAGAVAHRSWVTAGSASLLFAAVVACAPVLAPALVTLWAGALLLTLVLRAGKGLAQLVWVVIPAAVIAAPLVWRQLHGGAAVALLADPGVVWQGSQVAADAAGRMMLAVGLPTPDAAGWLTLAPDAPVWWVPLLIAPLAALALLAPLTARWVHGIVMLVVSCLGIGTAFFAVGIAVSATQSEAVALWPGTALSLAWLGVLGGALVTLENAFTPRLRAVRTIAVVVSVAGLIVLSVPSLTAPQRGATMLTNGPSSTLPAYVAAKGRDDPDVGTIVLTPLTGGALSARVVWGGSETLGAQSTIASTRTTADDTDSELANLAVDLVTSADDAAVEQLAGHGVSFVLLAPVVGGTEDVAGALRLSAVTALDQRDTLDAVGETAKGSLWRVAADVSDRTGESASVRSMAQLIALAQLIAVAAAVLLSVPTSNSRRATRRTPRIVGGGEDDR